jgi:hypothetical protein
VLTLSAVDLNRCIFVTDRSVNSSSAESAASSYIDTSQYSIPSSYSSNSGQSWSTGYFHDMLSLRAYIFGFGLGVSFFLSFGYLFFLRIPGVLSLMIWTVILGMFLALLASPLFDLH